MIRNTPILTYLNYLNVGFLGFSKEYAMHLIVYQRNDELKELKDKKDNIRYSDKFAYAFNKWFLCRTEDDDVKQLYTAIMNENNSKAYDICRLVKRPPSVRWLVVPHNLNELLHKKREPCKLQLTYEQKVYKPTNLMSFCDDTSFYKQCSLFD